MSTSLVRSLLLGGLCFASLSALAQEAATPAPTPAAAPAPTVSVEKAYQRGESLPARICTAGSTKA